MRIVLPGNRHLEVELNDGPAAARLAQSLPVTLALSRWGDEYYGSLPAALPAKQPRRDVYAEGEVALWPEGNAFCIFFGPTPVSHASEPRMASPGIPLGRITSDFSWLKGQGARLMASLEAE